MLPTRAPARPDRSSEKTLTASEYLDTARPEPNWRYLYTMRAGRWERHARGCSWCRAFFAGENVGGPCPVGLDWAKAADGAMDAAAPPPTDARPAPQPDLALF
jgi:hypothetical protein